MKNPSKASILTQLKAEFDILLISLITTLLATLVVFTIPIWNIHPILAFITLFIVNIYRKCLQSVFFVFCSDNSKRARYICIFAYSALLLASGIIMLSGYYNLESRKEIYFEEMNDVMIVKYPYDNGMRTPVRRIPFGNGGIKRVLVDGTHIYVYGKGFNSHGNVWCKTEYGWIFNEHLVEVSDRGEEQQLLNEKFYQELQKSNARITCLIVGIIVTWMFVLVSLVLTIIIKWSKRKVNNKQDET